MPFTLPVSWREERCMPFTLPVSWHEEQCMPSTLPVHSHCGGAEPSLVWQHNRIRVRVEWIVAEWEHPASTGGPGTTFTAICAVQEIESDS